MQKTIGQWLQEGLTPEQFDNAKKCIYCIWSKKVKSLSEAIGLGFVWDSMPEGHDYWWGKAVYLDAKGE